MEQMAKSQDFILFLFQHAEPTLLISMSSPFSLLARRPSFRLCPSFCLNGAGTIPLVGGPWFGDVWSPGLVVDACGVSRVDGSTRFHDVWCEVEGRVILTGPHRKKGGISSIKARNVCVCVFLLWSKRTSLQKNGWPGTCHEPIQRSLGSSVSTTRHVVFASKAPGLSFCHQHGTSEDFYKQWPLQ